MWSQSTAMKLPVLTALSLICASAMPAMAADKAMFCKAAQKDMFAPENFALIVKQDKVAYLNDANAFYINYRVKFERGPEMMSEAFHDNGEILFQLYNNNNKEVIMTFAGGVKGRYSCSATNL